MVLDMTRRTTFKAFLAALFAPLAFWRRAEAEPLPVPRILLKDEGDFVVMELAVPKDFFTVDVWANFRGRLRVNADGSCTLDWYQMLTPRGDNEATWIEGKMPLSPQNEDSSFFVTGLCDA